MSKRTVNVFGAGPAGLAAAHELALRGYEVTVFDARSRAALGGKCRTQPHSDPTFGALPGEHGFRFFPAFYWHAPELMRRIPLDASAHEPRLVTPQTNFARSVRHNLVNSEFQGIYRPGQTAWKLPLAPITGPLAAARILREVVQQFMHVSLRDTAHIVRRFASYLATCEARRDKSYDNVSLWDFVGADSFQPETQRLLNRVPRTLVAMDARSGNVRTFFNTLFMMGADLSADLPSELAGTGPHRLLNGPTSLTWIDPWVRWLERLGVRFVGETRVEALTLGRRARVQSATLSGPAGTFEVSGDHFVMAVPLEELQPLISESLADASPVLGKLRRVGLDKTLGTMAGVQLYLRRDRPILRGHGSLPNSALGLTVVSQRQFWGGQYLPSGVEGVLSLCITAMDDSDFTTGVTGGRATRKQLVESVIAQLRDCNDPDGNPLIEPDDVIGWHIDADFQYGADGLPSANRARLLIHPPGQLNWRPDAKTEIDNLVLAGDFVKTPIDLATMEGAVCSAFLAANAVLERDGSDYELVLVQHDLRQRMEEPTFGRLKRLDEDRYRRNRMPLWLDDGAPMLPVTNVDEIDRRTQAFLSSLEASMKADQGGS